MKQLFILLTLCAVFASCGLFKASPKSAEETQRSPELEFKRNTYFYEALARFHANEYDAARELLLQVLAIDSTSAEAHYKLGDIILTVCSPRDTMMIKQALHHAQLATLYAPNNKEYLSQYAYLLTERGRYEEALVCEERLTALAPTAANYYHLSQTYKQLKRYDDALRAMNHIENMDGSIFPVVKEKAAIIAAQNDTVGLFSYLNEKVNENPDDAEFLNLLCDYHVTFNQADSAKALFANFLVKDPYNVTCQVGIFLIHLMDFPNNEKDIWEAFQKVIQNPLIDEDTKLQFFTYMVKLLNDKKMPLTQLYSVMKETINSPLTKADIPYYYAYLMDKEKMPTDSIAKVLKRGVEIEPGRADIRQDYINLLYTQGDIFQVVREIKEAQKVIPGYLWFYYFEASLRYEEEDIPKFIEILERGVKLNTDPEDELLPSVYLYIGDGYQSLNRYDKAYEAYEKCLAIDKYHPNCLNNYAYFLALRNERLDYAEEMSLRVMDIEPNNPTYIDTYAWILYLQGKYPQAKIFIDKTIQLLEENYEGQATLLDHAGDIYLKCDDVETARDFWQKALQVSDDAAETKAIKKKLKVTR
ncbi:MAG: hypothetical protein J6R79_04895 [Bacteroidaceae bacterium]|nr:hypothetical protein [Bacteroidaceae bacterium]